MSEKQVFRIKDIVKRDSMLGVFEEIAGNPDVKGALVIAVHSDDTLGCHSAGLSNLEVSGVFWMLQTLMEDAD